MFLNIGTMCTVLLLFLNCNCLRLGKKEETRKVPVVPIAPSTSPYKGANAPPLPSTQVALPPTYEKAIEPPPSYEEAMADQNYP
ncbi:hypothetical protein [Cardinium endosymbiont of Philonthus spinipes]|uniref:hypothetical protein n=1 Tax=Cardinium endosymbiont of Philonthus spinipes TaxID=3077941 RepID=UPI00313C2E4A